jgi:hypothetical protein
MRISAALVLSASGLHQGCISAASGHIGFKPGARKRAGASSYMMLRFFYGD